MMKEIVKSNKDLSSIATKNYRNSPLIRDFYRFVAKNGLREEAFKALQSLSNDNKKKISYLNTLVV